MADSRTRIYLDACCLNRPFDDQTQDRVRLEAEAVILILDYADAGEFVWVSSEALDFELSRGRDRVRRHRLRLIAESAHMDVTIDEIHIARAEEITSLGIRVLDALHIACAESAGVSAFLTTDDRLLSTAGRLARELRVQVANPLSWLHARLNV
jgi:predicted nucleic acid-binding protein